jgi:hypothetical protein
MTGHISSILLISFLFVSCSKNVDPGLPGHPGSPLIFSKKSVILKKDLPPVMGGDVAGDGSLYTFSLQVKGNDPAHKEILLSAKILSIDILGASQTKYDFGNVVFSLGSLIKDSIGGIPGWIATGIRANLVSNTDGSIWFSSNCLGALSMIQNNTLTDLELINGLTSITSNRKKGIFAIRAPVYTGSYPYVLSTAPVVYEIDSLKMKGIYYIFPNEFVYRHNCGYYGSETGMYPADITIDMVADGNNNLYVCFGYDNVIYKLDKDRKLSVFIDDISNPASIAIDYFNRFFVVSGPEFRKVSDGLYAMIRPVEVIMIENSKRTTIYTGELKDHGGCFSDDKVSGIFSVSDANYNISIGSTGEIFLEDPVERQVVLIK